MGFLLQAMVDVRVDSLVYGFGLRFGCGLEFEFRLKLGCDCDNGLWVGVLALVVGVVEVGYEFWHRL